ncbi:hypothetical protein ACHAXS_008410 [Conticribra weissflogii]
MVPLLLSANNDTNGETPSSHNIHGSMTQFTSTSHPHPHPHPQISIRPTFKHPPRAIAILALRRVGQTPRRLPPLRNQTLPAVPFGTASLASSMAFSDPTVECNFRVPNWSRLDSASSHDDDTDDNNNNNNNHIYCSGTNSNPSSVFSNPREASAAYRSGKLRSDRTFPGHAFAFCRRVECDVGVDVGVGVGVVDEGNGEDDGERRFLRGKSAEKEGCWIRNRDGSVVVWNRNGNTLFARKRKCDENENNVTSSIQSMEWEAFLVVGGYRPGFKNPPLKGNAGIQRKDSGASDVDDDRGESMAQLVTIHGTPTKLPNRNATNNNTTTDQDEIDDPAPHLLDCYSCIQSIPVIRGLIHLKRRHPAAFVATESSSDTTASATDPIDVLSKAYSWNVCVCTTRIDPTPIDTSKKKYDHVVLGGWPCRLEPGCFDDDDDHDNTTARSTYKTTTTTTTTPSSNTYTKSKSKLRQRFESDILSASNSLPPHARTKLQTTTPIWINKSQSFGPKAAPIRGKDACFHPGRSWLVRNGMNPEKCGGVEFYDARHYWSDCDLWGPGGLILHELCHAWHCLHTEGGYDNGDVKECYEKAMEEGLYECVGVHGPQGPKCKAYACQDPMEYFAELSVAFLGGVEEGREFNKWFPFNRAQLKEHDPRAFEMMCRIWGVDPDGRESS